jgi:hypothetical protein
MGGERSQKVVVGFHAERQRSREAEVRNVITLD